MLDDNSEDDDGNPKIDIQLKMKLFQMGQDWLARRKKLLPDDSGGEGEGIRDMRSWMSDPDGRAALRSVLHEEGFVQMPPKKHGRPTKAEAQVHERFRAYKSAMRGDPPPEEDDSGLKGMLKDTQGEA